MKLKQKNLIKFEISRPILISIGNVFQTNLKLFQALLPKDFQGFFLGPFFLQRRLTLGELQRM